MQKNQRNSWNLTFLSKILFILLALWSYPLHAEVDAQPSVEGLVHVSDGIVVGVGTITRSGGSYPSIQIVPMRIIKGNGLTVDKPFEVTIFPSSTTCRFAASSQTETAIWFLKTRSDGTFRFSISPKSQSCHPMKSDYETSPAPLPSKWVYSNALDPRDKLAYELAASIEYHQGDGPFSLILNSQLLQGVSAKSGRDIYSKLETSGDANTRLVGLLGLARQGDLATLQYISSNLGSLENTPARKSFLRNNARVSLTYGKGSSESATTQGPAIAESIEGITNPNNLVVRELGKIMQNSSDQLIRYAAARALQDLHTALAITLLAPRLNDSDPQMRAFAIGGLSCFANGVPVIDHSAKNNGLTLSGTSSFKTTGTLSHFAMGKQTIGQRESFYLDYWRDWWSANSGAVDAIG